MKKYLLFAAILLAALLFYSCGEDSTGPEQSGNGSISITSSPSGAQIWNNNTNTGKVTPDSLTGLAAGTYSITLKYQNLNDTTISVTVTSGQTARLNVRLPLSTVTFIPVRIWETTGTDSTQPSGLSLSLGKPVGVTSADKNLVDLYYHSLNTAPYEVNSANLASGLSRKTYFYVTQSTNLEDTTSAPAFSGTVGNGWVQSFPDDTRTVVFVHDNDNHFSKLLIVGSGGGVPGSPAWLDMKWIYNKNVNDRRF
ncbi:MAG: PEGA domain-containing protein [Ignavibacteria bacterium]|jgi:hypothetical protein|nr:PEGA domain-containing protein [Ignavibacteria bacterium]MCU7502745.1 PEGA domain-containing protein [Ignavibacteria bacterium]MCU7517326.1 PEGA domain-containing protein [Ignavibacteria bacterium]